MIRDFTIQDHEEAFALWKSSEHIGLSSADDWVKIKKLLERNPGMSKVAVENGQIIGTILCGHDGRRGYLYHLYVEPHYRRQGLGKKLVEACLEALHQQGINKCHLFIFGGNEAGKQFWHNTGWQKRDDIVVFSHDT